MADLTKLSKKDIPPALLQIPDPPAQLYVRGDLPGLEKKWLTVVGSRAMSSYGRQACEYLIEGLRGYPIVIVSGLAYGVDAAAHKAALAAGLTTVAVPGSGLDWDVLYPRANVSLAREILKSGGALLSEFEPGQKAGDYTFPMRNRIMVGLAQATLVIEAKERSGSLITARLTAEYNRELLVVPGSIFSAESRGTHQFLKLGATPVTSPEDILRALGIKFEEKEKVSRTDVSEDEARILEIISEPLSRDELIQTLELPISEANILLSTMEIKGLIVEELGVVRAR
ncbi:MAG: DNA-processing protein DprA [bacterium]|nr:DNA-processing protein DprA [bacterium]